MNYAKLIKKLRSATPTVFTREELYNYYQLVYGNTNVRSFQNALSYLKKYNILTTIESDKYIIANKKIFEIEEQSEVLEIFNLLKKGFPNIRMTVWNSNIINEFTMHYSTNNYIIVEVEKIAITLVINYLKEIYLNKYTIITQDIFNNHREIFLNNEKLIIVKPLLAKSPLQKNGNQIYPSLEKLMVDIYVDKIFMQYQGKELENIFYNIFEKYEIDMNKLTQYAKRRTNLEKYQKELNNLYK